MGCASSSYVWPGTAQSIPLRMVRKSSSDVAARRGSSRSTPYASKYGHAGASTPGMWPSSTTMPNATEVTLFVTDWSECRWVSR